MKITKKVKARVDKLIDNILDGTDLHVWLQIAPNVSRRPRAPAEVKMGSFITFCEQISAKKEPLRPRNSRCPSGPRLQSCLGARAAAFMLSRPSLLPFIYTEA